MCSGSCLCVAGGAKVRFVDTGSVLSGRFLVAREYGFRECALGCGEKNYHDDDTHVTPSECCVIVKNGVGNLLSARQKFQGLRRIASSAYPVSGSCSRANVQSDSKATSTSAVVRIAQP